VGNVFTDRRPLLSRGCTIQYLRYLLNTPQAHESERGFTMLQLVNITQVKRIENICIPRLQLSEYNQLIIRIYFLFAERQRDREIVGERN
jgi:hypothetical protein